jgi:hypothetical protein
MSENRSNLYLSVNINNSDLSMDRSKEKQQH